VKPRLSARQWPPADQATEGPRRVRDKIILVGTNHARASLAVRERLALSHEAICAALIDRPQGLHEVAILSTCNRSEFYAVAGKGGGCALISWIADLTKVDESDLSDATYCLHGHAAITHLFKVSSGLDSMVLGEPHILGQVRTAFDLAMQTDSAGPVLSRLGLDAVHVGKTVRTKTDLARNRLSIPHVAIDLAANHVKPWHKARAVVVGSGEMGILAAKIVRSTGIGELTIVNRDETRGRSLAGTVNAGFAPFAELLAEVATADLVISAASVDRFLIRPSDLVSRDRPLVAVDLGVPRTIDPALRDSADVSLFDIDDLERFSVDRRASSAADLAQAELMVDEARDSFLRWWAARESAPAITELSSKAEQIRAAELDRALRKLTHLPDRDRNVVATLSVGIVNKLLHEPITNLRGSLDGGETAAAMRRIFNLEPEHSNEELRVSSDSQARTASWDRVR
jgi:glutamyl-tRNA reductase